MKIAEVVPVMLPVPPRAYGGIQRVAYDVATGLASRGHHVTVFCSGDSTLAGKNLLRIASAPWSTIEHPEENRAWEYRQIEEVWQRQKEFDVIHFHYEPAVLRFHDINGLAIDFASQFSTPTVFTFHNATRVPEHIQYYQSSAFPLTTYFVFISRNQQEPLAFLPRSRVIYNGIDTEGYSLGNTKESSLLFLGRMSPEKGILQAIEVAKKSNRTLRIAARVDSPDRVFYETSVKPLIDGHDICFVGEVEGMKKTRLYQEAAAFLMPIQWDEPFGLVMVEALACGTPVIAFSRGSVPEIIQDGVNGYIVETVDQMVEAVHKISRIQPADCRSSVQERFNVTAMVDGYERILSEAASSEGLSATVPSATRR